MKVNDRVREEEEGPYIVSIRVWACNTIGIIVERTTRYENSVY